MGRPLVTGSASSSAYGERIESRGAGRNGWQHTAVGHRSMGHLVVSHPQPSMNALLLLRIAGSDSMYALTLATASVANQ